MENILKMSRAHAARLCFSPSHFSRIFLFAEFSIEFSISPGGFILDKMAGPNGQNVLIWLSKSVGFNK
jgi:hypothetical protein